MFEALSSSIMTLFQCISDVLITSFAQLNDLFLGHVVVDQASLIASTLKGNQIPNHHRQSSGQCRLDTYIIGLTLSSSDHYQTLATCYCLW